MGRLLMVDSTLPISALVSLLKSVPFGKYRRTIPFRFSLVPRCQAA